MKGIIQIAFGGLCALASLALLVLMAFSEIDFKDLTFAIYFGIFGTIAGVAFFVLTRKEDNEETNPGKDKVRR
jgi:hypothetical protein